MMPAGRAVLFGFEPFLEFRENPSEKIVQSLDGQVLHGLNVEGYILPVDFNRIEQIIMDAIDGRKPSIVLGLGLAPGRSCISVEKIAINYRLASAADNAGRKANGQPVDRSQPDGLFSNMDVERTAAMLNRRKIPATVSLTAGGYLCNSAMFIIAREARKRGFIGGFLHIPCDEEMASRKQYCKYPFMPLERMTEAVRLVISSFQVKNGMRT